LLAKKWGVAVTDNVVIDPAHSMSSIKTAANGDVTVAAFSAHPAVKNLLNYQLSLQTPRLLGERAGRENAPDAPVVSILFQTEPTATLVNNPTIPPQAFSLAVAVEKKPVPGLIPSRGHTRMIIVGDSFFLANGALKLPFANRDFAHYALNWLLNRPQYTEGIGPQPFSEFRVVLTQAQMTRLSWLLLGAIPGGILLLGGLVWWRRRK
jgi:hypothetical protein